MSARSGRLLSLRFKCPVVLSCAWSFLAYWRARSTSLSTRFSTDLTYSGPSHLAQISPFLAPCEAVARLLSRCLSSKRVLRDQWMLSLRQLWPYPTPLIVARCRALGSSGRSDMAAGSVVPTLTKSYGVPVALAGPSFTRPSSREDGPRPRCPRLHRRHAGRDRVVAPH